MSARAAALETTTVSGISAAAARRSRESERQARERVEDHAAGLLATDTRGALGARRQLGVVGERGADADDDGVDRRAPAVGELAASLAADPLRVAGARGDLAVERHRRLEQHPRAPGARVLAESLVEQAGAGGELAVGHHDLDALVAQDAEAAAGGLLGGVVRADDDAPDPGLRDRLGAGRRLALVAAGLERHVQRGSGEVGQTAGLDRIDLGVGGAEAFVPPLPQHLAVARHDGADDGVGLDRPDAAPCELDRAGEVQPVGVGDDGHPNRQDNRRRGRSNVKLIVPHARRVRRRPCDAGSSS